VKVLKLNPLTLTQESRYHTQDFAERVSVLQHEWIQSTLYILVKHNQKSMEGLGGEYATVQGNAALKATNQSGELIFFDSQQDLVKPQRCCTTTMVFLANKKSIYEFFGT